MIRVKYEDTEFDSIRNRAVELLTDQGYTQDYMKTYIADHIAIEKYHGIELAYDSEYGTKATKQQVLNFADDFIVNYVYSAVVDAGEDYEYDYTELIDDLLKEHEDDVKDFNREFEYLEKRESDDYQAEIDDLNRYYYSTRGV